MPIVCNELLGRPLLKIYQDTDGFNFSLDSMLLADFASVGAKTAKSVICVPVMRRSPYILRFEQKRISSE